MFEFEALLSAIVSAYEVMRFSLPGVSGKAHPPRSFELAVTKTNLPNELREAAQIAKTAYQHVKRYRDCIMHYAQFGAARPCAKIELKAGAWSACAVIPDDPDARSTQQFRYDHQLDALELARGAATALLGFARSLMCCIERRPPAE